MATSTLTTTASMLGLRQTTRRRVPRPNYVAKPAASHLSLRMNMAPESACASTSALEGSRRRGRVGAHSANGMQPPMAMTEYGQQEPTDPMSMLLKHRILFLGSQLDTFTADLLVNQLLLLSAEDGKKEIRLYINSPGGSVHAGLAVYDTMQMIECDVATVCLGLAGSMSAFLLAAGTKGKRNIMPNSRVMLHQPLGGSQGTATDVGIQARELMFHRKNVAKLLSHHTGRPLDVVERDTERDHYMSALESMDYGVVDHIIGGDDESKDFAQEVKKAIEYNHKIKMERMNPPLPAKK